MLNWVEYEKCFITSGPGKPLGLPRKRGASRTLVVSLDGRD